MRFYRTSIMSLWIKKMQPTISRLHFLENKDSSESQSKLGIRNRPHFSIIAKQF